MSTPGSDTASPSDRSHPALDAMGPLRRELTQLNVDLLQQAEFGRAQQVTRLLQETCELEERIRTVVADNGHATAATRASSPPPTPGGPEFGTLVANPDDYPRYVRRGDLLIKIGLRRDKTDTYEQKLPRKEFNAIREALLPFARSGEVFEAPQVIGRAKTPSYLVYLLLGLLQVAGFIVSPSRGKYSFKRTVDAPALDGVWTTVPAEQD